MTALRVFLVLCVPISLFSQGRETADWVDATRPVNKMVTLQVTSVDPARRPMSDGRRRFVAQTADGTDLCGSIDVVVGAEDAASFARRYGTESRTRNKLGGWEWDTKPLRGLVVEDSTGALYIDLDHRPIQNAPGGGVSQGDRVLFYVSRVHTTGASPHETQQNLLRLFGLLNYDLKSKGQTELTQNEFLGQLKNGERYSVIDQGREVILLW